MTNLGMEMLYTRCLDVVGEFLLSGLLPDRMVPL